MDMNVNSWWVAVVVGLAPVVIYAVWYWNDFRFLAGVKLRRVRPPPGHMGLPFLGETLSLLWYFNFVSRPDDFIITKRERLSPETNMYNFKYGEGVGMYRSHLFGRPTVITCTPASNKFVLQNDDDFETRWPSQELVGLNSISSVDGKEHTRLRSFVVNAVNKPDALRRIAQIVQPHMVSAIRSWAEKGTIKSYPEVKKVTFETICKMLVSMDPSPVTETIDQCFQGLLNGIRSYPIDLPGTAFHHALRCRRKVNEIFREELEKRKMENRDGHDDLMDGLMRMKDEEGMRLSDEEVIDNIVSLVIAGYESTSLSSMWAIINLSKTPAVLRKLRKENMELHTRKKTDFITLDDVSQLKYTAKVVEEVIRTANVAPIVHRFAKRDVEYKGHTIPKGWQVLVWVRCLHTDAKYFDDPLIFNPERWNERAKPGTFQVFGGGPRICAGNMLARLQLTLLLHHLSLGYRWELINPDAKVTYLPHSKPVDEAAIRIHKL